jgi:hypothetical protein
MQRAHSTLHELQLKHTRGRCWEITVAMRHGIKKVFSVEGIRIVLDFWASRGHRVVGFLPEVSSRSQAGS